MKIPELPLLGDESSDRSRWVPLPRALGERAFDCGRWASALKAAHANPLGWLLPWSGPDGTSTSLRPQPHSPPPRALSPLLSPSSAQKSHSALLHSQGSSLSPKRRLTPSHRKSLRSRGSHTRVRGPAEQAESTDTERFKKSRGPLLSAREAGPQTELPDEEALERGGREVPWV